MKLFQNKNTQKKQQGLFGNLSNSENESEDEEENSNSNNSAQEKNEKKTSLKKKNLKKKTPIFSEKGEKNPFANSALFSGSSLFANLEKKEEKKGGLFSSSLSETMAKSSLFSNSSLFGGSSLFESSKKNESEEEGEGEDEQKPGTPTNYDPISNPSGDSTSIFKKEFVKEIESFYELTKIEIENKDKDAEKKFENKYLNKGKGFLSLEFTNSEQEEKSAIIVYR